MSESLGSAVLDLSADDSDLDSGLSSAEQNTKSKMGAIGGIIGKAALATGAALAAVGAAAIAASFKVAALADQIDKNSKRMGVSTEFYQEAEFWASQNGISAEQLTKAMGRLNGRIGEAIGGNEKYASALNDLGVEFLDVQGNARDTEDVFRDTIGALQAIENPAERAAAAAGLFGDRVARDLMPALSDGRLSMEEATEIAHELGLVMSQDAVDAGVRFTDQWDQVKRSIMGVTRDAVLPFMTVLADDVFPVLTGTVIPAIRQVIDAFGEGGLAGAFQAATDMFSDVGPGLIDTVRDVLSNILSFVVDNIGGIVDFLIESRQAFFDAAIKVFTAIAEALPQIIPQVIEALLSMVTTLVQTLVTLAPLLVTGAVMLITGLVEGIIDALPLVIDAAIDIITTVLTTLLDFLPDLLQAGIEMLVAIIEGLVEAIPLILAFIIDMIPLLVDTIIGLLPLLLEAGIQIQLAVLEGMIAMLPKLIGMIVTDLIPSLLKALLNAIPQLISAGIDMIIGLLDGLTGGFASDVAAWFASVPGLVAGFFSGAGRWLVDAGKAILSGLLDGLKAAWNGVKDFVGGIGDKIKNLKGPLPEDKVLLVAEGEAILQGLQAGLESEMAGLEATLRNVTGTITSTLHADDILGGDGASMGRGGMHVENLNVEARSGFDLRDIEDEVEFRGAR